MDRFLASLQINGDKDIFSLTGSRSISIRDQMIRGTMVAQALPRWLEERYGLETSPPPVLVAGAGMAGMTVALGLARQGIRVEVLNPSGEPFGLQRRALRNNWFSPDRLPAGHWTRGRWIDPLQYDWPMDHWRDDRVPYNLDPVAAKRLFPFAFQSGRSADLAEGWQATLFAFDNDPSGANLFIHDGWYLSEFPLEKPGNPGWPYYALIKPVAFDLRLMSWGDGTGVPTSGNDLVVAGIDNNNLLHIRIFDRSGRRVTDTNETKIPSTQAQAISTLKQHLPGLLPPHVLTPAEKVQVLNEATSIVGQTRREYSAQFSAVIQANGAGDERVRFDHSPDFTGLGFWDSDPFEDPTYGGKVERGCDDVLISGTGDGGLQDLLQVLTRCRSARQSYEELELDKSGVNLDLLHSVECRHDRAATWANHPNAIGLRFKIAPYMQERHWIYRREVDRLLAENPGLRRRVLEYVGARPRTTYLVGALRYFDPLYGLNLFMAMLLIRALRTHSNKPVVESMQVHLNRPLLRIDPHDWTPPVDRRLTAAECLGRPWAVTLDRGDGEESQLVANVVIVRQGLGPHTSPISVANADPRLFPRPMPPVHLHH